MLEKSLCDIVSDFKFCPLCLNSDKPKSTSDCKTRTIKRNLNQKLGQNTFKIFSHSTKDLNQIAKKNMGERVDLEHTLWYH